MIAEELVATVEAKPEVNVAKVTNFYKEFSSGNVKDASYSSRLDSVS